jgi:hypothetical protein
MKMKKIIAAIAASAVSMTALAAVSLSAFAEETTISYTGPSTGAYKVEGTDLRVNIWNTWGNDIKDLDTDAHNCSEWVKVDFTVSGLNGQTTNKDTSGANTDSYYAFLGGAVGANAARHTREEAEAAGDSVVNITGDGQYTATFNLADPADTILCLYLQTNINAYNREGFANDDPSTTGINISIDKVYTVTPKEEATTESATTEAAAAETTTAAQQDNSAATTTTSTAKSSSSGSSSSKTSSTSSTTSEKSAQTGDAGAGLALLGAAVAVGTAFVAKKKD